jgi:hypothetical protein
MCDRTAASHTYEQLWGTLKVLVTPPVVLTIARVTLEPLLVVLLALVVAAPNFVLLLLLLLLALLAAYLGVLGVYGLDGSTISPIGQAVAPLMPPL